MLNSPSSCRLTPKTGREPVKAQAGLDKLRAVASRQTRYTYQGTPVMQAATPFRVNRLIDLGASVVSPFCTACFQTLQPMRPIPELKYQGSQGCA